MSKGSPRRSAGIISETEAIGRIGPELLAVLAQIPHRAWKRYQEGVAPNFANPPSRQLAVSMHTLMIEEAERALVDRSERVTWRYGRALLSVAQGVVVQFKLLDDEGLPQNYPTEMANDFANQVEIEGIPPGVRLTLGYELDRHRTAIASVSLLCQRGERVEWRRDLETTQRTIPIFAGTPLPSDGADSPQATPQRRLKPKDAMVEKKKDPKTGV